MQNLLQKALLSRATLIDAIAVAVYAGPVFIGHFWISLNGFCTCFTIGIFLPSFYLLPY
jgi:hypothetical protein